MAEPSGGETGPSPCSVYLGPIPARGPRRGQIAKVEILEEKQQQDNEDGASEDRMEVAGPSQSAVGPSTSRGARRTRLQKQQEMVREGEKEVMVQPSGKMGPMSVGGLRRGRSASAAWKSEIKEKKVADIVSHQNKKSGAIPVGPRKGQRASSYSKEIMQRLKLVAKEEEKLIYIQRELGRLRKKYNNTWSNKREEIRPELEMVSQQYGLQKQFVLDLKTSCGPIKEKFDNEERFKAMEEYETLSESSDDSSMETQPAGACSPSAKLDSVSAMQTDDGTDTVDADGAHLVEERPLFEHNIEASPVPALEEEVSAEMARKVAGGDEAVPPGGADGCVISRGMVDSRPGAGAVADLQETVSPEPGEGRWAAGTVVEAVGSASKPAQDGMRDELSCMSSMVPGGLCDKMVESQMCPRESVNKSVSISNASGATGKVLLAPIGTGAGGVRGTPAVEVVGVPVLPAVEDCRSPDLSVRNRLVEEEGLGGGSSCIAGKSNAHFAIQGDGSGGKGVESALESGSQPCRAEGEGAGVGERLPPVPAAQHVAPLPESKGAEPRQSRQKREGGGVAMGDDAPSSGKPGKGKPNQKGGRGEEVVVSSLVEEELLPLQAVPRRSRHKEGRGEGGVSVTSEGGPLPPRALPCRSRRKEGRGEGGAATASEGRLLSPRAKSGHAYQGEKQDEGGVAGILEEEGLPPCVEPGLSCRKEQGGVASPPAAPEGEEGAVVEILQTEGGGSPSPSTDPVNPGIGKGVELVATVSAQQVQQERGPQEEPFGIKSPSTQMGSESQRVDNSFEEPSMKAGAREVTTADSGNLNITRGSGRGFAGGSSTRGGTGEVCTPREVEDGSSARHPELGTVGRTPLRYSQVVAGGKSASARAPPPMAGSPPAYVRRNVVQLKWVGSGPPPPRKRIIQLILGAGFTATDVYALINPMGTGEYELSFVRPEGLDLFMEKHNLLLKGKPEWDGIVLNRLSTQPLIKKATILTRNESIPPEDLSTLLRRYAEIVTPLRKVPGEEGFWAADWEVTLKLRVVAGIIQHVPSSAFLGKDRLTIFYPGQPKVCFKCGARDHFAAACRLTKCSLCQELGHVARECQVIRCNLCGTLGHPYSQCPEALHNVRGLEEELCRLDAEDQEVDDCTGALEADELALEPPPSPVSGDPPDPPPPPGRSSHLKGGVGALVPRSRLGPHSRRASAEAVLAQGDEVSSRGGSGGGRGRCGGRTKRRLEVSDPAPESRRKNKSPEVSDWFSSEDEMVEVRRRKRRGSWRLPPLPQAPALLLSNRYWAFSGAESSREEEEPLVPLKRGASSDGDRRGAKKRLNQ